MTSWMAERDRLLAQANSLVQGLNPGLNTARPTPSASSDKPHERPLTPQPRPLTAAAPPPPASPSRPRSVMEGEADHQPLTFRRNLRTEAQPAEIAAIPLLANTERDDLEIRVSRFREQQTKLAMERQAFCEEKLRDMHGKMRNPRKR